MTTVILVLLILLNLYLIFHSLQKRKESKEILAALRSVKKSENRKAFAQGSGISSEVCFEINEILAHYQKQISKLETMEKSNKELLTSLSHDVRTPLTSLMGYLDALEKGIVSGDEKERYIMIAKKKAYDLKTFVDALFQWFKINSNEMKLNLEKIDINEITREILIDFLPMFEAKNISLEGSISDEELIVTLDKEAYTRILSNLIQNAIAHGGNLLSLSIENSDNCVRVIVSDNGEGIAVNKLPYIFDRLYKCDSARSSGGSGLGLSIVKGLVEVQGGNISAESVVGEYTKFIIEFPSKD